MFKRHESTVHQNLHLFTDSNIKDNQGNDDAYYERSISEASRQEDNSTDSYYFNSNG